ncbi:site-specific DNA-methyltransferase [Methanonatronarchaeum sp. AMET6-2]|uniref:DNA-methyltransferase n=1 Tax=Methanonatronarchaeum sp. AMET6-2 TaxID=2933293 RepID=UPI001211A49D|nr:site-specific DNA-methyltransferase [Methanonatronarchaeum sp. AMET6-2]RZN60711.1 MAG: site-specific DNA-methyltransferase [Methanonatronarchaeia archaeon]UOY09895.1 site-specific DNA-methyltransferase [Methanonatronarchaeum sp. AMET6-2]
MQTTHKIINSDSRNLNKIKENQIELVVTSPPYPMIEMWDSLFHELNPKTKNYLENGEGRKAFQKMHQELDKVWKQLKRVLIEGGIACINIGDATRKVDGSFRVYQNHSRIINKFTELGFDPLPEILWRKPVNSATKFMGSGMLPPNAYATLEHEYILIFRNGQKPREFPPKDPERYQSAYFWEERNQWFTDLWTDIKGTNQTLKNGDRDRSAAYPLQIPYRLINMYSTTQDTVLDPFWGTGTTTTAAITTTRNSIGIELNQKLINNYKKQTQKIPKISKRLNQKRLQNHINFIENKTKEGQNFKYQAENYNFPVKTKQEKNIQLYHPQEILETENGYQVKHTKTTQKPQ